MKAPAVGLLTILFSGLCGAASEHQNPATFEHRNPAPFEHSNPTAFEQACECATAHLLQSDHQPVPETVAQAWEAISSTIVDVLARINDLPAETFPSTSQLAPVIRLVNVLRTPPCPDMNELDDIVGPSIRSLEHYFAARSRLLKAFVEEISWIASLSLEAPIREGVEIGAWVSDVASALQSRDIPSAEELNACWAHIVAMTNSDKESERHRRSFTEFNEMMHERKPLAGFTIGIETHDNELEKVESQLRSLVELHGFDSDMAFDLEEFPKIQELLELAKRQCESLEAAYEIIQESNQVSVQVLLETVDATADIAGYAVAILGLGVLVCLIDVIYNTLTNSN